MRRWLVLSGVAAPAGAIVIVSRAVASHRSQSFGVGGCSAVLLPVRAKKRKPHIRGCVGDEAEAAAPVGALLRFDHCGGPRTEPACPVYDLRGW